MTARQKQYDSLSSLSIPAVPIRGTSYYVPAAFQVLAQTKDNNVSSKKFLQDLVQKVQQWQSDGDLLIVMADMNKDIMAEDIKVFCRAMHLVEVIHHLHRPSPTPTHQ